MASLILGYEYDIFISYRQKDNKHDSWVSEFVTLLKGELEATFKEDISVYFDINPHDGLLETHDVSDSLKEKLKCLVFIPIISQTYCDPKSFAWEHEFKAFVELASHDQFGLKVKLPNGNIANRILPVQIHDLDSDDKALFENELGGVLRPIEFIYKETGVNRPLRANEENPARNLNQTFYRNQVNKAANAIKEILYSITKPQKAEGPNVNRIDIPSQVMKSVPVRKNSRFRPVFGIITVVLLILIFSTKTIISKNKPANSIIVLPISTQDSSQKDFAEGITIDVITELAKVRNLSTKSWNTSAAYAHSGKPLKDIAKETGVSYVLTVIIQRDEQNIRVNVELVSPENGKSLWARRWDTELKNVFDIQKQIAKDVAMELGVKLSMEERTNLDRYSTRNFEAYELFYTARNFSKKFLYNTNYGHLSNNLLDDALEIDPDFPQALTLRANNLLEIAWKEGPDPIAIAVKAKEDLNKSLRLDPDCSDTYIVLGILNYFLEWDFQEAKKNLEKGWELSNYGEAPITQCFCGVIEFNLAKGDYLRALTFINKVEEIDPEFPYSSLQRVQIYANLKDTVSIKKLLSSFSGPGSVKAFLYYQLGDYDKAIKGFLTGNTNDLEITPYLASSYFKAGMTEKCDSIVNQLITRSSHERNIDFQLASIYGAMGDRQKALVWYKSAYQKHDIGITSTLFRTDLKLIVSEPEVQHILKEIGIIDDPTGGM
jgi:TolB-like protein